MSWNFSNASPVKKCPEYIYTAAPGEMDAAKCIMEKKDS